MKETILKHIELNETYHESKERLAWLATALYLSFSIAAIEWLRKEPIHNPDLLFAGVVLFAIYLAGLAFTAFQFRRRWSSVYTTYALRKMLKECQPNSSAISFPDRYDAAINLEKGLKENGRRPFLAALFSILFPFIGFVYLVYKVFGGKKDWIDSRYHTEVPSYGISFYLFIVQLVLLGRCYDSFWS